VDRTELSRTLRLPSGAVLPNRIAKSAMSERLGTRDGAPSEDILRLYERWAGGGAGLLVTGNVMIDRAAIGESGNVVVEDDRHLGALRAWARVARAGGAKVWMQINHPGRQVPRFLSREPVAPSAVGLEGTYGMFARPRALGDAEIEVIVQRFALTAAVAEAAGFDGVQIHGAHGYLISQFLSARTNLRTDRWGGSPERRRRFLLEVVKAVRAAVRPGFVVALKLNSADFQRGGFSEEESMAVVEALEGIDLLEISGGTYEAAAMFAERKKAASTRAREAFFLEYAEKVRSRVRGPLMVTGGFRTAGGMAAALASGAVDVVGLARPLAAEPDLPARLLAGAATEAAAIKLDTGVKKLDAVIQGGWYQMQLDRMGRGLAPDLGMSRVRAVLGYLAARSPRERARELGSRAATARSAMFATSP
jgi:2,4-dienoyl-CoA reductase-like NADH-dependent reductase (Old Yellow Enzyme family)